MRLVSRFVTLALGCLALAACTDQAADAAAKAAAERKKEVSAAIAGIEQQAKDGTNYAFVVREVGKRRAQAWGDAELLKRLDDCVEKARKSRDDLLQTYFGKAEAVAKAALAVSEPEASAQACRDAIDVLDGTKTLDGQQKIPAAVVLKFQKELEALRTELFDRFEVATRARELLARAKALQEAEQNAQARAALQTFETVESWKSSPFSGQLKTAREAIPEAAPQTGYLTVFDGEEAQFSYFLASPPTQWYPPDQQDPFLTARNDPDDNDDDATAWLGDDTWGDFTLQILFKILEPGTDGAGFKIRLRCQKDTSTDHPLADDAAYDKLVFTCDKVGRDTWVSVRVDLRGDQAEASIFGSASREVVPLRFKRGRLGFSVPRGATVDIKEVKIKLGEGAKPPETHKIEKKTDTKPKGPRHKRTKTDEEQPKQQTREDEKPK